MNKSLLLLFLMAFLNAQELSVKKIWTTKNLPVCESIIFSESTASIYVSCINGKPAQKNNSGFISRLNKNGEIINRKWAINLNAPKGMGIYNQQLFVADIDEIKEINLNTGKIEKSIAVPNANFLNDIAIDNKGNVFVSDTKTNSIYLFDGKKISKWLDDTILKSPNGLLFAENKLLVGNSGSKEILVINIESKKVEKKYKTKTGIDGLKIFDTEYFLISDWVGHTYLNSKDGRDIDLLNTTKEKTNSADLEYINKEAILIIPTFYKNRIDAYKIRTKK